MKLAFLAKRLVFGPFWWTANRSLSGLLILFLTVKVESFLSIDRLKRRKYVERKWNINHNNNGYIKGKSNSNACYLRKI